jgi:RNA polymerase sigma-70 factor (ECF subfamily)
VSKQLSKKHVDNDAALLAAYRRGDDVALSALVERYQTGVYRIARGVLVSHEEAEDATQEAIIAMLASLHRFRGDSRFSTWLYRLTLNTCLKRRARSSRRREDPFPRDDTDVPGAADGRPDVQAGRLWLQARISQFLAALSETYRLPVVLSDALNLPASEIATVLDISLPAAKARLLRGRARLRAEVERYCEEAGLSGWRELVKD